MKLKSIVRTVSLFAVFLMPALTFAGNFMTVYSANVCNNYFCWLGNLVLVTVNDVIVPVLFAIAFIVFLYGIAKAYFFSGGSEDAVSKGHRLILWGIIAFVVMISLWGMVNVVANTLGLAGYGAPILPMSPVYH